MHTPTREGDTSHLCTRNPGQREDRPLSPSAASASYASGRRTCSEKRRVHRRPFPGPSPGVRVPTGPEQQLCQEDVGAATSRSCLSVLAEQNLNAQSHTRWAKGLQQSTKSSTAGTRGVPPCQPRGGVGGTAPLVVALDVTAYGRTQHVAIPLKCASQTLRFYKGRRDPPPTGLRLALWSACNIHSSAGCRHSLCVTG